MIKHRFWKYSYIFTFWRFPGSVSHFLLLLLLMISFCIFFFTFSGLQSPFFGVFTMIPVYVCVRERVNPIYAQTFDRVIFLCFLVSRVRFWCFYDDLNIYVCESEWTDLRANFRSSYFFTFSDLQSPFLVFLRQSRYVCVWEWVNPIYAQTFDRAIFFTFSGLPESIFDIFSMMSVCMCVTESEPDLSAKFRPNYFFYVFWSPESVFWWVFFDDVSMYVCVRESDSDYALTFHWAQIWWLYYRPLSQELY